MTSQESPTPEKIKTISGRWIVVGMFLMGIFGGFLCVSYAFWHNAPFIELKKALAEEYPKSTPQVEGGVHKGSPMTLRIIVNVNFHPGESSNDEKTAATIQRIAELAQQHQDLQPYELLRIHLIKKNPQDMTSRITRDLLVADLPKLTEAH